MNQHSFDKGRCKLAAFRYVVDILNHLSRNASGYLLSLRQPLCTFLLLCSALFFLSTPMEAYAQGKGHGVEVRLTSARHVETEPGEIVTAAFRVRNKTDEELEFVDILDMPDGWRPITQHEEPFVVGAEAEVIRTVAFHVPPAARSGEFDISYTVRAWTDYGIVDSDSFSLRVEMILVLELMMERTPDSVLAGDDIQILMRLVNRGNIAQPVTLSADNRQGWPVNIEPESVFMRPGMSKLVKITVETDKTITRDTRCRVSVRAEAGRVTRLAEAEKSVMVDVIPRAPERIDPYRRIDAEFSLIGVFGDRGEGMQAELSGGGFLDEDRERRVDFLLRAPNIVDKHYGQRDEYRASYSDETVTAHAGDRSYSLSHLTERARYGRGVELNLHPGERFETGAHFVRQRWGTERERQTGAYAQHQMTDWLNMRGNVLRKDDVEDDHIFSLQSHINPREEIDLGLEYGYSDTRSGPDDTAYRIDFSGRAWDSVRYSLLKTRAEPDYAGYYNDMESLTTRVHFPIVADLGGNVSYREYSRNLDRDTDQTSARRTKRYGSGINYRVPTIHTRLSLDYLRRYTKDVLPDPNYDFRTDEIALSADQRIWRSSFRVRSAVGEYRDRLDDSARRDLERHRISASIRPSRRQSYSAFYNFGHSNFTTTEPRRSRSAGASGRLDITRNIHFNASYSRTGLESATRESDRVTSALTYTLPNEHRFSMRGSWTRRSGEDSQNYGYVSYTVPFGVPVARRHDIGSLRGVIYDAETRRPYARVPVRVNERTAVTDDDGVFEFPTLHPGQYQVELDRSALGLDKVPVGRTPFRELIEASETQQMDIPVTRSAEITGRVAVFGFDNGNNNINNNDGNNFRGNNNFNNNNNNNFNNNNNNNFNRGGNNFNDDNNNLNLGGDGDVNDGDEQENELIEIGTLSGILVELRNDNEVLRHVTGNRGDFAFKGIRPGQWTLKVYENNNLPNHYYLERDEYEIEVGPGEKVEKIVRVLPRERRIRIIDEGEVH